MVIISTTPTLEGRPIRDYLGIVTGEVIVGANIFKDLLTSSAAAPEPMRARCAMPAARHSRNCATKPSVSAPMRW